MRKRLKQLFAVFTAAVVSPAMVLVPIASAANTTVIVSETTSLFENHPNTWFFNRDPNTDTPYEFNNDAASIGSGSLYVAPIGPNAADKFIGEYFINQPVSNFESISYDFKIGAGGEEIDKRHFYMNVYVNHGVSDDFKFYDCRFDVVPTLGSTSNWTTVTFDKNTPMSSPNRVTPRIGPNATPIPCPATLGEMSTGSTIRAIAINLGDSSLDDQGLDGYFDKVVVTTNTDTTTFDFEPEEVFQPTGEIKRPLDGSLVRGKVVLKAIYDDGDDVNDDAVQWAVRSATCTAGVNTVWGNVDTRNDPFTWDGAAFRSVLDTKTLTPGKHCFVFNPTDDAGQNDVRETREFYVAPRVKDDCKNNGWQNFGDNFANQGQCTKYVQLHKKFGHHHGIKWWKYWWWN